MLCGEALLKFAIGTCVRASGPQIANAVSDRQYGVGRPSGAPQEVAEVRAAATAFPEDALLGLDIKNAFGAAQWADALLAVVAKAPR